MGADETQASGGLTRSGRDLPVPGGFRIVSLLGEGGMGAVYRAVQLGLDREVALKYLLVSDPQFRDRFLREGQVLARLTHPNIMQVYGYEILGDQPVLICELVSGNELAEHLKETPPGSSSEVVRLARPILEAIGFAHAAGITHRDLKPGNILIAADGVIRVMDFGLASCRDAERELTRTGVVMGTPTYMAPEQASGLHVDHRADLYSLGVILFEMFSGRRPFESSNPIELLNWHRSRPAPSLDTVVPGASPALVRLIARCLEKDPALRPASTDEILSELEVALRQRNSLRKTTKVRSVTGKFPRPAESGDVTMVSAGTPAAVPAPRRARGWWALLLLAMLAGGLVLGVLAWRNAPVPDPRLAVAGLETGSLLINAELAEVPGARVRIRLEGREEWLDDTDGSRALRVPVEHLTSALQVEVDRGRWRPGATFSFVPGRWVVERFTAIHRRVYGEKGSFDLLRRSLALPPGESPSSLGVTLIERWAAQGLEPPVPSPFGAAARLEFRERLKGLVARSDELAGRYGDILHHLLADPSVVVSDRERMVLYEVLNLIRLVDILRVSTMKAKRQLTLRKILVRTPLELGIPTDSGPIAIWQPTAAEASLQAGEHGRASVEVSLRRDPNQAIGAAPLVAVEVQTQAVPLALLDSNFLWIGVGGQFVLLDDNDTNESALTLGDDFPDLNHAVPVSLLGGAQVDLVIAIDGFTVRASGAKADPPPPQVRLGRVRIYPAPKPR